MKILVPYDDSPEARNALGWAERLGARSVTLLDVSSQVSKRGGRSRRGRERKSKPGYATQADLGRATAVLNDAGIHTFVREESGSFARTVVRVAENDEFDLILIGLRKRHPILFFLFGSPSLRVAKRSSITTVLVPWTATSSAQT